MLLLDTHVWLWSAAGDTRHVGRRAQRLISQAESTGTIRISAASVFEAVALHTHGRIRLTRPVETWIRESVDAGARVADLTTAIAIDAGSIPPTRLEDPIDRLLVATARQTHATFLTADTRILAYAAATEDVVVHNASL